MLIITVTITSIIIGASFIRPWWASCHINESFVFVVKVSCCFSLVSSPVTRHLAAAPSNDQPAHCNDSQPASRHTHTHTHTHTHQQTKHTQPLISNSSERHAAIFFPSPSQALLNSLYAFPPPFFTLSHFLLFAFAWCVRRLTKDTLPLLPSIFSSLSHSLLPSCLPWRDHWDRNHK